MCVAECGAGVCVWVGIHPWLPHWLRFDIFSKEPGEITANSLNGTTSSYRRDREREFLEVLQNGCVLLAALLFPHPWGAGVWVNTERAEIHHEPRSANSCNLQSTLTLCKKPASMRSSSRAFLWRQHNLVWCVCNDLYAHRQTHTDSLTHSVNGCRYMHICLCRCE